MMEITIWNLEYYNSKVRYQPETRIPNGALDPKYLYWPKSKNRSPMLPLEDATPDGGTNLQISTLFSGRRIISESVPKKLTWHSKLAGTDDFQWTTVYSVSDRLHDLIEKIEPKTHQFERLDIIGRYQSLIERRWFWQVCNRIDSIVSASGFEKKGQRIWYQTAKHAQLEFDIDKIGNRKFWREKSLADPWLFCTDFAKEHIEQSKMTGALFKKIGVARAGMR